jgi:Phage portal protein, SPP1 Gp6-like
MPNPDVQLALNELRAEPRRTHYQLAGQYYLGDHRLAFATERFRTEFGRRLKEYSDNLCAACVDSLTDRLQVTGFTVGDQGDALSQQAWDIWQRNRMDLGSAEVHRESLLKGDGYVIVWPDQITGEATMWPQCAEQIAVFYDANVAGRIMMAAKLWVDNADRWRLDLYYSDRVEKWASQAPASNFMWGDNSWKNFYLLSDLVPDIGGVTPLDIVPNPYGQVPVFHWPNKRINQHGISELLDIIPLQDALNKAGSDLLVAMEFSSYKQRWVTGIDTSGVESGDPPFRSGADTIFATENADARFGQFESSELSQFLAVQESLRSEIARVSGTPLHYLFITRGDFPSGEAMKSAEARFTRKIMNCQTSFGNVWEDALAFALRIEGESDTIASDVTALWETASPRSERELLEVLVLKKSLGVSEDQLLREMGYPSDKVDELLAASEAQAAQDRAQAAQVVLPTSTGRMRFPGNQA